ncbi:hypothetical protein HYN59_06315 [Flavobacterium album]|uniref:Lipocalin-like domain-containing protein n=1 Tax=Flavobacterium album TaxID=2175091 RepID=A0A2S1QWQ0_9FLAO|nr:lipocalin family protein [Flavobacterium album]AWH84759.1 hypothetical protein HYN59_06315 [Flavobacterium album]
MKKVLGLSLALAFFASCSDDDGPVDMGKLTRKWYQVSTEANGETEPYDENEVCGKDYIEFISGGTFKSVDVYDCDGTMPLMDTSTDTYTTSGHTITVGSGSNTGSVTVEKLNSNELKISYQDDWDGDGDEEKVIETYTSTP